MLGLNGLIGRFQPPPPEPEPSWWASPATSLDALGAVSRAEAATLVLVALALAALRRVCAAASRRALASKDTRVLKLSELNRVVLIKELFLAYLNAGMLEPILAVAGGGSDLTTRKLLVNLCQLLGLVWWLYLLTDSFDDADVKQVFLYHYSEISKSERLPVWLTFRKDIRSEERKELAGSMSLDIALWYVLFCILAAWCGLVSHTDVIHSYAVLGLWLALHHTTRRATCWLPSRGAGYLLTLLMPSTALLPLEYSLPLLETEDLEGLVAWRSFVLEHCGVPLNIVG